MDLDSDNLISPSAIPDGTTPPERDDGSLAQESTAPADVAAGLATTGQPPKVRRRHTGLIVAIVLSVLVLVLLAGAGGGFMYLRQSETRLLDQAQASLKAGDWAGTQDACAQLAALPLPSLLVDPQRCLPLTGEAYFQTGKLDLALSDLQAANLRYPDQVKPYVLITEIYAQQGKTEQAMTASVEAKKRDDTFALPYTLQAVDAFHRNQYKEAEQAAQEALKRDPKQEAALRVLGTLESWRGEAQAFDHLNQALALVPGDLEALAARGCLDYEQGRYQDFDTDIAAVLNISMTAPESLLMQALRASSDHDMPKAYKLVDQAIQQKSDRPEYYYYRGQFFPTTEKDYKTYFADLDKTLQLAPDFYEAQADKLAVHFYNYETVDLVAEGNRLIETAPGLGAGQNLLVIHYARLKDWDHALEWANKLVDLFPKSAGPYVTRGDIQAGRNKFDLALIDYQMALRLNPNSTSARVGIADALVNQNKNEDAMIQVNNAIQISQNAPGGYVRRAYLFMDMKDNEKARIDIDKALQLDPLNFYALNARVTLALNESDFTKASEDIARIADLSPKSPVAHILRGLVYLNQKDKDAQRAMDEFKQAIQILPTESWAQSLAAEASYDLKNYDQAMTYANEALRLDPSDGNAQGFLAEIYFQKNDYPKTVDAAQLALALKPSQTWLYLLMSEANVAQGDYATAAQNLKDALAHQDTLSTDGIQKAEKDVAFFVTVPPLVDGMRTVDDKTNGFSLSYSTEWTPTPISKSMDWADLILTDSKDDQVIVTVQILKYTGPSAYLLTAQMFADYFRQDLALQAGYKFTTRTQFKGLEFGTVDGFETSYKTSSGTVVSLRGQMYVFYISGRAVIIEVTAPPDTFPKYKSEFDKLAATFKFLK
jgi:tetratricopeptide (TPR) repeat protein